jgi:hypothetical protein
MPWTIANQSNGRAKHSRRVKRGASIGADGAVLTSALVAVALGDGIEYDEERPGKLLGTARI